MDVEARRERLAQILRNSEDIKFRHQQEVVNVLNNIFDVTNVGTGKYRVRIMHYNGERWACLRFINARKFGDQRLEIYHTRRPNDDTRNAIRNWNVHRILSIDPMCVSRLMSSNEHEEFLNVLAQAVCLALGHLPFYFIGASNRKIREVTARVIETGELPRGTADQIWYNA